MSKVMRRCSHTYPLYMKKETYIHDKRDLRTLQKRHVCHTRPIHMSKVMRRCSHTYPLHMKKRDLLKWQRRPPEMTKDTNIYDNRDLHICHMRPTCMKK